MLSETGYTIVYPQDHKCVQNCAERNDLMLMIMNVFRESTKRGGKAIGKDCLWDRDGPWGRGREAELRNYPLTTSSV